jgi:molecular chaperone GrpE
MADKEQEIPVKVVDRRWWAKNDDPAAGPQEDRASAKPSYVEQLEQQLAEKDRQLQDTLTKYREASGDFEQARIRLRREVSKDVERGRRDILSDLLEVVDNLDRAIESARAGATVDALLQGVDMVRRQFLSKLEALGVSRIDVQGQQFDPALHEAITTVPATSPEQDGQIVGVVRSGYRIGDDVLRPAAVAVAKQE